MRQGAMSRLGAFWVGGLALFVSGGVQAQTTLIDSTFDNGGVTVAKCSGLKAPHVSGVLPTEWVENTCWKSASSGSVTYALDAATRQAGSASLAVTSTGTTAQFYVPLAMKTGKLYRATVYLRADTTQDVTIQVRAAGAPYTSYGLASTTVGAAWTAVSVIADAPLSASHIQAGLFVLPTVPGKIWVDSVSITEEASGPLVSTGQTIGRTFFGAHTHRDTKWPAMGGAVSVERFWDGEGVQMRDIFPTSDLSQANWTRFEERIARAQKNGADIIFTLGGNLPAWATMSLSGAPGCNLYGPGSSSPPTSVTVWNDLVRAVVTKAAGRIKYWEIWNEPSVCSVFNQRTPNNWTAYMATLSKEAYATIKGIDATNQVLSPSFILSHLDFVDQFYAAGGGQYADIVSVHAYDEYIGDSLSATPTNGYRNAPEMLFVKEHQVLNLKNIIRKYIYGSTPIWDTESGYMNCATPSGQPDDHKGAPYVARHMLLAALTGVERTYHYSWDVRDKQVALGRELDYVGSNNYSQSDAGRAYENMAKWLTGAQVVTAQYPAAANQPWVVKLSRSGVTSYIVWNPLGTSVTYAVPTGMSYVTTLLGSKTALSGTSITIDGWPRLLSSQ